MQIAKPKIYGAGAVTNKSLLPTPQVGENGNLEKTEADSYQNQPASSTSSPHLCPPKKLPVSGARVPWCTRFSHAVGSCSSGSALSVLVRRLEG